MIQQGKQNNMDIKAPTFPESITEGTVAQWHKQPGEAVKRDDLLADIETDKVVIEVVAPDNGTLTEVLKAEGEIVESEEVIALFEAGDVAQDEASDMAGSADVIADAQSPGSVSEVDAGASPAARKLAAEAGFDIESVRGSGRDGRVTKEDVAKAIAQIPTEKPVVERASPAPSTAGVDASILSLEAHGEGVERRVPMTRMRASIAKRLVEAQRNPAMLTTFNEIDMSQVMAIRKQYKESFKKKYQVNLGMMSFFIKASVEALKEITQINAFVDGQDIIEHHYYHISVAIGSERGLVVPVIRHADKLSFAGVEEAIVDYVKKINDNRLEISDLEGGTFTISNGGVYGSLLSTPI